VNVTWKRILIVFSAALNIGFILSALILVHNHPPIPHQRFSDQLKTATQGLGLAPDQEEVMVEVMERFEKQHRQNRLKIKGIRNQTLALLARPGPLDVKRFDALTRESDEQLLKINQDVKKHLSDVRKRLGDEKGAGFFSALLDQARTDQKESP